MTVHPYFSAKAIYDDMRRKRQLYPIQHTGKDDCPCSLCIADREKAKESEKQ